MSRWIAILLLMASILSPPASAATQEPFKHALIIGVSIYRDEEVPPLFGVPNDLDSAKEIAVAMGIPEGNVTELFNEQATKDRIIAELGKLAAQASDGGRILVYFSGHGTRWRDPNAGGCVEGLLTWDRKVIVNREFAQYAKPLGSKADKLIIMFDACHSGGIAGIRRNTRSLGEENGGLRPKFFMKADETGTACNRPSNVRTRSLLGQNSDGVDALPENVVHITSARADEVSFDEPSRGGLATQAMKSCLLGGAKDLDGSGAVTLAEVEQCAQDFISTKVARFPDLLPHHVTVTGLRNLIPVAAAGKPTQSAAPSAEAARLERERLQREQAALEEQRRAEERRAAEQRAEKIRQEQQRLAAERGEAERLAKLEQERLAREAEQARLAQLEKQRLAREAELAKVAEAERKRLAAEAAAADTARRESERLAQAALERRQREEAESRAEQERLAQLAQAAEEEKKRLAAAEAERLRLAQLAEAAAEEKKRLAAAQAPVSAVASVQNLYDQRDPRRTLAVTVPRKSLRIGQDPFELTITSKHDGYVYIVLLGSDQTSFYLLFPNGFDGSNKIKANAPMRLPRPNWGVMAGGPPGTDHVLVLVTDNPRELSVLSSNAANPEAPYTFKAADAGGRRELINFVIGEGVRGSPRFAAAWLKVEEVQ
ncbi:MAG: caspase family protein [Nevskiaceae bacterium]